MVAQQPESRTPVHGTVVYRSQDRRFTIIVDRHCRAAWSSESGAWLTLSAGDRQKVFDFLKSLEQSTGEVEVKPDTARTREIVKALDSMLVSLEELNLQDETTQRRSTTDIRMQTRLVLTLLFTLVCLALSVWFSRMVHSLAVPFGFAAVLSAFAALMTYVGSRTLAGDAPRWVRGLNAIRECLANEPQTSGSAW